MVFLNLPPVSLQLKLIHNCNYAPIFTKQKLSLSKIKVERLHKVKVLEIKKTLTEGIILVSFCLILLQKNAFGLVKRYLSSDTERKLTKQSIK